MSFQRMANVLKQSKREQVLALGRLGWSERQIQRATGIRRETVGLYLRAAGIFVRPKGFPSKAATQASTDLQANPATQVSTDSAWPPPRRSPQASACEPHREFIESALGRGRNAMAIYQDLVDGHGFGASYRSVLRFTLTIRPPPPADASVVIQTAPGVEAQVDWGEGPMVRDATGVHRRTRLFVMTLGFSRKSVRLISFKSSTRIWAELHEESFRRFGGTPQTVVLDNLREGVLGADIHDPVINPLYADVLKHYRVIPVPCRVADPDRKGKVESGVGHAQRTPLKGLRFESIAAAQEYLDAWEVRWADTRIHGTTKRQVSAMFLEEKPALQALPLEPFRYYQFGERVVHLDGCVEVEGTYYGSRPGYIGQRVPVQWDAVHVRILHPKTRQLLREHVRKPRGHFQIHEEDRPPRTPKSTQQILARAHKVSPNVGTVCEQMHRREGETCVRRILGVLSLVKKHGAAPVDNACGAALEVDVPTYRFVCNFLKRNPPLPEVLKQVDPIIRELTHYRDLILLRTGETP